MKLQPALLAVIGFGLTVVTATVQAGSLRCNDNLAVIGDSKGSVLAKCGEPMLKDFFCKAPPKNKADASPNPRRGSTVNVIPCDRVDEWTYNPGPGHFYTILQFEQGTLKSMKDGDRVP